MLINLLFNIQTIPLAIVEGVAGCAYRDKSKSIKIECTIHFYVKKFAGFSVNVSKFLPNQL